MNYEDIVNTYCSKKHEQFTGLKMFLNKFKNKNNNNNKKTFKEKWLTIGSKYETTMSEFTHCALKTP